MIATNDNYQSNNLIHYYNIIFKAISFRLNQINGS